MMRNSAKSLAYVKMSCTLVAHFTSQQFTKVSTTGMKTENDGDWLSHPSRAELAIRLTYAANGEKSGRVFRRITVGEEWLQHVRAECERNDRLRTWPNDHAFDPQPNESHERAEGLHDVRVICARLGDHCTKFSVTVGADLRQTNMNTNIFLSIGIIISKWPFQPFRHWRRVREER